MELAAISKPKRGAGSDSDSEAQLKPARSVIAPTFLCNVLHMLQCLLLGLAERAGFWGRAGGALKQVRSAERRS